MEKILIIYRVDNWSRGAPIQDPKYLHVAELMSQVAEKQGVQIYHASIKWYSNGRFKKAFKYQDLKWKKIKNVVPDKIWSKMKITPKINFLMEEINSQFELINHINFERLNNKAVSKIIFSKWMPYTLRAFKFQDLKKSFDILKAKRLVIKPFKGSGGQGVHVISKKEVKNFKNIKRVVVQKFIDSSKGIKGICSGYHDLRLVFLKNQIAHAYIREPAPGKFLANIAQGGTMTMVPKTKLPAELLKIVKEIGNVIKHYNPRYYTLDFIFDEKQQPYLIELNTRPGAYFDIKDRAFQIDFFKSLIKTLKE